MADANIIVAVDHAIDVIEYLFSVKQEASIREISVATGMSNSSVHRQLLTLKERGYVYQNPETLKYWLGMRFYALGNLVKSNMPLVNLLSAALDALAEKIWFDNISSASRLFLRSMCAAGNCLQKTAAL